MFVIWDGMGLKPPLWARTPWRTGSSAFGASPWRNLYLKTSEQAAFPDFACGSEAVSGDLRALGSPQIDDLGFPRGRGRAKTGGRQRAVAIAREVTGSCVAAAVREIGDREAGELARDRPVDAAPDRALRGGFGGFFGFSGM